jgi:hypothetical protein
MMQLLLSWGYLLAAIASLVAALKTGQYVLLWGIVISIAALPIVIMAPIARNILETAVHDLALPVPVRIFARFMRMFSVIGILLWPIIFGILVFKNNFIGEWLVGTYIFASNTVRRYRAKWLSPIPFLSKDRVAPGETAVMVKAIFGSTRGRT